MVGWMHKIWRTCSLHLVLGWQLQPLGVHDFILSRLKTKHYCITIRLIRALYRIYHSLSAGLSNESTDGKPKSYNHWCHCFKFPTIEGKVSLFTHSNVFQHTLQNVVLNPLITISSTHSFKCFQYSHSDVVDSFKQNFPNNPFRSC